MDAREPIVAESDSGRYRGTEGYGAIGSGRCDHPAMAVGETLSTHGSAVPSPVGSPPAAATTRKGNADTTRADTYGRRADEVAALERALAP